MIDTRRKGPKGAGSVVFTCPWLAIRKDVIGTSGSPLDHCYVVERPDSITIVPISDAHRPILLRQHRYPINDSSWEFPMGQIEAGESAEMATHRELSEETSVVGGRLEAVSWYHPIGGLTPNEPSFSWRGSTINDCEAQNSNREFSASSNA
jgi:hypothetical protein